MRAVGAEESYSQGAVVQGEGRTRSVTCPRTTVHPALLLLNFDKQITLLLDQIVSTSLHFKSSHQISLTTILIHWLPVSRTFDYRILVLKHLEKYPLTVEIIKRSLQRNTPRWTSEHQPSTSTSEWIIAGLCRMAPHRHIFYSCSFFALNSMFN